MATSAATSVTGTAGPPASMSIEDTLDSSKIGICDGRWLALTMDGVSGDGLWRAVNMGGIGDGHQLVIANQLVGCNIRNGGRLAFTKCRAAHKRHEAGLEDVRIEKNAGSLGTLPANHVPQPYATLLPLANAAWD